MAFDAELEIVGGSSVVGHDCDDLFAVNSLAHCKGVVTDSKALARIAESLAQD